MRNIVLLMSLTLLIGGCTIQKRVHMKGYYVSWNKSFNGAGENQEKAKKNSAIIDEKSNLASNDLVKLIPIQEDLEVFRVEDIETGKSIDKTVNPGRIKMGFIHSLNPEKRNLANIKTNNQNSTARLDVLQDQTNKTTKSADMITIGLLSSLSLLSFLVYRKKILTGIKIASWAKRNQKRTQTFLVIAQIAIGGLGLLSGFEFAKMGYEMSNLSVYGSLGLLVITFASHPSAAKIVGNKKRYLGSKLRQIIFISTAFALFQNIGINWKSSELDKEITEISDSKIDALSTTQVSYAADLDNESRSNQNISNLDSPSPGVIGLYYFLTVLLGIFMAAASCGIGCLVWLGLAGVDEFGPSADTFAVILGFVVGLLCLALSIFALVLIGRHIKDLKNSSKSKTVPDAAS